MAELVGVAERVGFDVAVGPPLGLGSGDSPGGVVVGSGPPLGLGAEVLVDGSGVVEGSDGCGVAEVTVGSGAGLGSGEGDGDGEGDGEGDGAGDCRGGRGDGRVGGGAGAGTTDGRDRWPEPGSPPSGRDGAAGRSGRGGSVVVAPTAGVGAGGTGPWVLWGSGMTTGPTEGVGMNRVPASGSALLPTEAEPVLIAARIGIDAVPASNATVSR
ncbi:hypothetical protein [Micromonospora humi]|uniref:Uncharacterized protein n=1 Tax=Micromonospora humi TaxID=745366 RepID=A0A1C5IDB1_9ACTN|nr:hypothetical protein [Micromonospora humi]SCG56392.1 hypothetical protein GA0070213_105331 [Micromonospora humi]